MMTTFEELQAKCAATESLASNPADLRQAVADHAPSNPCLAGFRSVCWKIFLLSTANARATCPLALRSGRRAYQEQRDLLLRYIEHPEALAELTLDPLTDDPEVGEAPLRFLLRDFSFDKQFKSPWNAIRKDELIRAEIQQDVRRLPDEANYHDEKIQAMILDVLFIYCKTHPERGGYRQGMHELLAPLVHVIGVDAVDRATVGSDSILDEPMLEMLDSAFMEHDAFILFRRLMDSACEFYKTEDIISLPGESQDPKSTIVERSQYIHEVCLRKLDPQLATHLTDIEILPQIFLIRWIRLLFSREFAFDQLLIVWDTLFAIDPQLRLINFICCAMLIRIRWQLLEADYSGCLQMLLKYPTPEPNHGPRTFVEDAAYLRDHFDASGGATLIAKYSGRMPDSISVLPRPRSAQSSDSRAATSPFKKLSARSPLTSPSWSTRQHGGVESLISGAAKSAKGVLEKSERLGINQAVRDAVGEIRRNFQSFNEARLSPQISTRTIYSGDAVVALAAMERRNRQLAGLLQDTVADLKAVSAAGMEDTAKVAELIELAAAKIQFVQIYLDDPSLEVSRSDATTANAQTSFGEQQSEPDPELREKTSSRTTSATHTQETKDSASPKQESTSFEPDNEVRSSPPAAGQSAPILPSTIETRKISNLPVRPAAPIPTRSTLAQSSFSWMLEPDESGPIRPPSSPSRSPPKQHKKRVSNNMSHERNAFLFGGPANESGGNSALESENIFGMQTIKAAKGTHGLDKS